MRINIIHHHLHPGGVTRVIDSQIRALKAYFPQLRLRLVLGYTTDKQAWEEQGVEVAVNQRLNYLYDSDDLNEASVKHLAEEIEAYLLSIMHRKSDLLHVHNLNLGKNPAMTYAVFRMALQGYRVLNHAHDFAEDRPANYKYMQKVISTFLSSNLKAVMYPKMENYSFAVLNSYDFRRLENYGVESRRIALLENPVAFSTDHSLPSYEQSRQNITEALSLDATKKIVTYPVRVIRRKNIGEFILLAYLFGNTAEWIVTQPPKNPQEQTAYFRWKEFCSEHGINVHFEAGTIVDFEQLLVASDFCITTSRQEGFGMVYLEPWLMNTPIIGRDLPDITQDMKNKGIEFPVMYQSLNVVMNGRRLDFKDAEPELQQQVILKAMQSDDFRRQIITQNSFLGQMFEEVSASLIQKNQQIIKQEYSYQQYANKLYEIYQASAQESG